MSAKENLTIRTGATFTKTWIYMDRDKVPITLSEYEARMMIRERIEDTAVLVSLTSSPAAGITLENNFSVGQIDVRIGADVTELLAFDRGVYDLEIYKPADLAEVIPLVDGAVILKEGVTR